jgi:hypothetical protein
MVVSVMQPYLFPYLGYFQLIAASELFVSYDDVQFIKGGWINRNRILVNGKPAWITLPLRAACHTATIRDREYVPGDEPRQRLLRQVAGAYHGARNFRPAMRLIESIMGQADRNVAAFNERSLREVASFLRIPTRIVASSSIDQPEGKAGVDKVIAVCKGVAAHTYLNPIGGDDLYDAETFATHDIELRILEPVLPVYDMGGPVFVPSLSIIDVLMHNDLDAARRMLESCRVRPGRARSNAT